ncbi:SDR family NAD(P)-dependent oxidoreductase [Aquimarina sp. I32.4]|uniref:SDR family NAD(P)-dependent oxidoreductase n=1 Tax=Aquimarina sp. I32.4 TaxID=2053903 RepID=UPI000CDE591D|nr:SDR family NAD(P)-dependent oxidoreductase [Aquimarina sp. I32.4]
MKIQKKEENNKTICARKYSLNLPHLLSGAMSENWLLKELGDVHWAMIFDSLGVKSDKLVDNNGDRLYASFVRLKWESDASLKSFNENEEIKLSSELSHYGKKTFFSDSEIVGSNKTLKASLMSVFSAKKSDNNENLSGGANLNARIINVHKHKKLPKLAKEYLAIKSSLFSSKHSEFKNDNTLNLYDTDFNITNDKVFFSKSYLIDAYDDINGVGLLYFATYSKISDKCELSYFQQNYIGVISGYNWADQSSCIARDIHYYGNANANEKLLYNLEDCYYINHDTIQLRSSLYREKDKVLIAKIFTIKKLAQPLELGCSIDNRFKTINKEKVSDGYAENYPSSKESSDVKLINMNDSEKNKINMTDNKGVIYNREIINRLIIDFFSSMFEEEFIDLTTDLRQIGIESIAYTELSEYLNSECNLESNPSRFYGLNTVNEITSYLIDDHDTIGYQIIKDNNEVKKIKGNSSSEDIAIIGTSFRVPGANTKEELWELLSNNKSAISETPKDRWNWPDWIELDGKHKGINKGGYIKDLDKFDPLFFNISPREAELIDPQQRILLELTWELLENSGYKASVLKDSNTGVFIGASGCDYELLLKDQMLTENNSSATGTSLAILANRISYFYGFEGPSLLLDTACSSSLVAIHEAVKALQNKECDQAIIGGVHLMCHPSRSLVYYESNMLSVDGKCQTFDEKANGYVRSEGAALVFAKPISKAIEDGDEILGIIKGTSVNHGGQSGGLTVPNPIKQQSLLEDAYKKAAIDVSEVSYIEVHGTGTSLGDPIEVTGLTKAFNSLLKKTASIPNISPNWCGIGSVKSNLGHLEAASGMAGVLKVLLSMEKGYLPASINYNKLNPKLELTNSPFYVHNKLKRWQSGVIDKPLIAGVSSFGIGGANAHIVIEEYIPKQESEYIATARSIILLSAKNKDRLKEQITNLCVFIERQEAANLYDIAYTLQVGRESMEERLAFVVNDIEELQTVLTEYLEGHSTNSFSGNIKKEKSDFILKGETYLSEALESKELSSLAQLWVKGGDIDWGLLYDKNSHPKKISLPTYAFAKERYWIPEAEGSEIISSKSFLHPLLHSNSSNLQEQRFTNEYTGQESFLLDHKVRGKKVLPGVAYLELARAAGFISLERSITQLKNITWLSPIQVDEFPEKVQINLFEEGDFVGYEVYSGSEESEVIHSQGRLSTGVLSEVSSFDIAAIKDRFTYEKPGSECYVLFKELGLDYGNSFRGIETLYYSNTESLSKISLPIESAYVLQPGILDSALQTCIGQSFLEEGVVSLSLPFSVKEVNIYGEISTTAWCYARKNISSKEDSKVSSYDIDILSDTGEVLLSFKGLAFLTLDGYQQVDEKLQDFDTITKDELGLHLYSNGWEKGALVSDKFPSEESTSLIILAGGSVSLADKLKETLEEEVITINASTELGYFNEVLGLIKSRLELKTQIKIIVIYRNSDYVDYSFISGLLKTAEIESPKFSGKTIGVESLSIKELDSLVSIIGEEHLDTAKEVRYFRKNREVRKLSPHTLSPNSTPSIDIKEGGVYLITGGAGGLGNIFSNYLSKIKGVTIILTGRSSKSRLSKSSLQALNAVYHSCDVTNKESTDSFIKELIVTYGKIDGIIHSAGVVRDSFLLNKTQEESSIVLNSKILGAKYLDQATKDLDLDFMIYFSSVAGVIGNIGQGDYSSANAWLDSYASHRNNLREKGTRKGISLSINWPLWKDGGMRIDEESEKYLKQKWGMVPLPTSEGVKVFDNLLVSSLNQGVVIYGYSSQISKSILKKSINLEESTSTRSIDSSVLFKQVTSSIMTLVSDLLKLDIKEIVEDEDLGDYGFDSISLTKLSNNLNQYYDLDLMPTLFYNYSTIEILGKYLIENHSDNLLRKHDAVLEKVLDKSIHLKESISETPTDSSVLDKHVTSNIMTLVSNLLKLDITEITTDEDLGDYGFDSISLTKLSNDLNQYYDLDLMPTLFYNYSTIEALVKYLIENHSDNLSRAHDTVIKKALDKSNISDSFKDSIFRKRSRFLIDKIELKKESIKESIKESSERIAVIGMSGRFPGSPNLDSFWDNLKNNKDLIEEIPKERWDWKAYYGNSQEVDGKTKAKWGGFIEDVDKFDPLFFNISPREAELMDPQQRITLEAVYHALEDSGLATNAIEGSNTGVFIGASSSDYSMLLGEQKNLTNQAQFPTGSNRSILANRISYLLDLNGPSEPIDTACSSSLIAIHRAIENIKLGHCDIAIAGGVNALLSPNLTLAFSKAGMLSDDGRCKTFDQSANGYVRGEGVGILILKSLSKAEADGDHIYGVIRGSSENHGGKANTLTSPNPNAQKELLLKAYRSSGIDPRDVSYIEAHGTGTPLGDPIEIEGLKLAFKELYKDLDLDVSKNPHCGIGSAKTNIGHLEAAAGIAGVMKVLLSLKHKTLPGNIHLETPNAYLKLNGTPFYLLQETKEWSVQEDKARIAGISSFGFGGSNAHVIIEEYLQKKKEIYTSNAPAIILLSAKNENRLKAQVKNLLSYLEENRETDLYDIAYTLQIGRDSMEERLAFVASNLEDLKVKLNNYKEVQTEGVFRGNIKKDKLDFLLDGEAGRGYIEIAIRKKESNSLAQLWVKGVFIDWNLLYGDNKLNKISLPTYPFAKERYWIPEVVVQKQIESEPFPQKLKREITLFANDWKEITLEPGNFPEGIVLIINAHGINNLLSSSLISTIKGSLVVNSYEMESIPYEKVSAVVDLGATSETDYNWVSVLQKVITTSNKEKIKLVHMSISQEPAIGKGLYQSLDAEYSKVSSTCLEIEDILDTESVVNILLNLLKASQSFVRIKNSYKNWEIPQLEAVKSYEIISKTPTGPVLITGGTRGLGMACAKHLVKRHNVTQLILLGKEHLPKKEEWEAYKTKENSIGNKVRDFLYLESLGAEIKVFNTSLSDKKGLQNTFSDIKKDWGGIKGLLHCAGIIDVKTPAFINKSKETIELLQEPKVKGLNILYSVLKEHELSYGLLFSSISSLVPRLGSGNCDYAMANSYMDSFAVAHYKEGYRSIQWPSWKEIGMGEVKDGIYSDLGLLSLATEEGLSILDQALSIKKESRMAVLSPMVYNPDSFKLEDLFTVQKKLFSEYVGVINTDSTYVSNWLSVQLSEVLKLPLSSMELDVPFQEYGVDSILLVSLVKQIEKQLDGISFSPNILLENPTIGMLSSYLLTHHALSLSKVLSKELNFVQEQQNLNVEKKEVVSQVLPSSTAQEPIAIIGIGCHFPEADNIGEFWDNLQKGKDSIKEVPSSRWSIEKYYSPDKIAGKSYSKWGAFLDNIEDFDPDYFGISADLASQIDPLERQWLEVSAEAMADSGYTKAELSGKSIGVYAGARMGGFYNKLKSLHKDFLVGTGQNFITAHLAHIYNLKGPNMVVDTACSSSLTAIDLAVKSLRLGETEMALAGGVDILLDENYFIGLSTAEILSADGRTKTFDENANGTGLGEGCGVLLLKRLKDAISSGDKIYGVIEGSAVNNDGRTMGITTPNPEAQRELIEKAILNGEIDRSTISYVETHGTGTFIGDPIELKGITEVLLKGNKGKQYCGVGSVKTNIGHLLSAAGVAGIIKTVLSISAGELPPTLNCEQPNSRFDFENSPVYPVRTSQKWKGVNDIRRAGVSGFGLGGNNAHVILSNAGIPLANRVEAPFNKNNIPFKRQRYWPEEPQIIKNPKDKLVSMDAYFDMKQTKEGADWVFSLDILNDNYIVRDHKVHTINIVPGVTYLDLILRCSKELFGEIFTLSRVLFIEPLATDKKYNRCLELRFRKGNHSLYEAMIRSKQIDHNGNVNGAWSKHIHCRLNIREDKETSRMDINSFIKTSEHQIEMKDVYQWARSVDIVHEEFMQTRGLIYQKGQTELMKLHLSQLSESYRKHFYLHPAFLDGATFAGNSFFISSNIERPPYIPFSIAEFSVYNSLPSTIYVFSNNHDSKKYNNSTEIVKTDISIYDETGNLLVKLKDLAVKKIRYPELIKNLLIGEKAKLKESVLQLHKS